MTKLDLNKSWNYSKATESINHVKIKDRYDLFINGEFINQIQKSIFKQQIQQQKM